MGMVDCRLHLFASFNTNWNLRKFFVIFLAADTHTPCSNREEAARRWNQFVDGVRREAERRAHEIAHHANEISKRVRESAQRLNSEVKAGLDRAAQVGQNLMKRIDQVGPFLLKCPCSHSLCDELFSFFCWSNSLFSFWLLCHYWCRRQRRRSRLVSESPRLWRRPRPRR